MQPLGKTPPLSEPESAIISGTSPSHSDPAEQSGYLCFFYRDWHPTRLARIWNSAYAWISGLGLLPQLLATLQVKSRSSDRLYSTILVVVSHHGQRYLVSMLGNGSERVRDARA